MNRSDPDNRPKWLSCKNALVPDMLAVDPLKMPVFEIAGAEFTKSEAHTADGISIRFPRITKQRNDKSTNEATTLKELKHLFEASKHGHNLQMLTEGLDDDDIDIKTTLQGSSSPMKRRQDIVESEYSKKVKTVDSSPKKRKHENVESESAKNVKTVDSSPKKRKQEKIVSENVKNIKTVDHNNQRLKVEAKDEHIFKEIVLYVCDDVRALCTEELRYFKKWWGDETENPKECTHVLHKSASSKDNLASAR